MAPRFSFERAYTAAAMLLVQIQLHVIIVCHHATENAVRPMFGPGFCWYVSFFSRFLCGVLATGYCGFVDAFSEEMAVLRSPWRV